ncbi:molybdenum cofactor biosynthesis protein [Nitriliruptor alkaliphilus]|uniref:molybdenum cofactor biosynthesis protein n=1 Tax=Nitriliruptor alkaliphilus TaxID=427918 RepID=UPI000698340D|nr:molybdenum cofactor biosynthesis protein MoaE [Nitriliruptor alkaliphilus]
MELEVRLFGGLWERAGGQRRLTVTVPDDATVADLRAQLAADHPRLAPLLARVNVAVDLEVASDSQLLEGATEVAVLPPVAGGAGHDDGHPRVVTGLVAPPFDVDTVLADITSPPVGAAVSFLGTVRDHAPDLDGVVRLDYSAYPEMAEKVLADIAGELVAEHPDVRGLALLHATGELAVGDHTILVAACAAHRAAAFDACRDGLERVKDRVPIWKREVTTDGEHRWVGLTPPPD